MSRIDRAASMARSGLGRVGVALPGLGDPRAFVLLRLEADISEERVSVAVPLAVRKVVAKHGSCRLSLVDDEQY